MAPRVHYSTKIETFIALIILLIAIFFIGKLHYYDSKERAFQETTTQENH